MKRTILHSAVRILILLGMLLGLLLLFIIVTGGNFFGWQPLLFLTINGDSGRIPSGILFSLAILGCEYIAFTLYQMMGTLGRDRDPFVDRNTRALKHMGFAALAVSLLCLGTLLFTPVLLAVVAALPIGMCGLFSLVLSGVFAQAVAYKEENDLTI